MWQWIGCNNKALTILFCVDLLFGVVLLYTCSKRPKTKLFSPLFPAWLDPNLDRVFLVDPNANWATFSVQNKVFESWINNFIAILDLSLSLSFFFFFLFLPLFSNHHHHTRWTCTSLCDLCKTTWVN